MCPRNAPEPVTPAHVYGGARLPKPSESVPREPLRAWMADLALWMATQPVTPSLAQQLEAANQFANVQRDSRRPQPQVTITPKMLRTLRERQDFQGLVRELERGGGLEHARAKYLSHLPEMIDTRLWATRHAREVGDHRGVGMLTDHALQTVVPPKTGPQLAVDARTTVIVISERQARGLLAPPIEVTAELLPEEPPPSRQLKPGR